MERKRIPVSHLTYSQAGRFVGVSDNAVRDRVDHGHMRAVDVLGVTMVSADDCRRWLRERRKANRRSPSTAEVP